MEKWFLKRFNDSPRSIAKTRAKPGLSKGSPGLQSALQCLKKGRPRLMSFTAVSLAYTGYVPTQETRQKEEKPQCHFATGLQSKGFGVGFAKTLEFLEALSNQSPTHSHANANLLLLCDSIPTVDPTTRKIQCSFKTKRTPKPSFLCVLSQSKLLRVSYPFLGSNRCETKHVMCLGFHQAAASGSTKPKPTSTHQNLMSAKKNAMVPLLRRFQGSANQVRLPTIFSAISTDSAPK